MGALNTSLFTQGWYIASIVLYVIAHYLAVGYTCKRVKKVSEILDGYKGSDIPADAAALNKQIAAAGMTASLIAVVMIVLMSVKPF